MIESEISDRLRSLIILLPDSDSIEQKTIVLLWVILVINFTYELQIGQSPSNNINNLFLFNLI